MNSVRGLQIALNVGYWLAQLFGVFSRFKDKSERNLWQKHMFAWKVLLYSMWKSYDKCNSLWWYSAFLNRLVIFCQNFQALFWFLKWKRHCLLPNDRFFSITEYTWICSSRFAVQVMSCSACAQSRVVIGKIVYSHKALQSQVLLRPLKQAGGVNSISWKGVSIPVTHCTLKMNLDAFADRLAVESGCK